MRRQVVEIARSDEKAIAAKLCWHLITSEYPPQPGGVSDYTFGVAAGLADEGDEVHVWCPANSGSQPQAPGVVVHRDLGSIRPADLRRLGRKLDRFPAPRRILVQWVPHGYGYRSMNVGFCFWLWNRARRRGDRVEIMLHEPYLRFRLGSFRQSAAALAHRLMTMILLQTTERVWTAIPKWEPLWRPYALGRKVAFQWLPIPSSIPIVASEIGATSVPRREDAGEWILIGHFGTYGPSVTDLLEPILLALAGDTVKQRFVLMGIGSKEFRDALVRKDPRMSDLVEATGALDPREVSRYISRCDLLVQPYPDGVSTRRTSFMAGLSHGKPVVTTTGILSEEFWSATGIVPLAQTGDLERFVELARQLRDDAHERVRLGHLARALYEERFDIKHVISSLRSAQV
jgi:glycosyltransferase involved in cell wall biosynthesis